jgi:2-succinyl-6-hydroxy-2,4-cyclohexadiene-1-carboxylate synthase
MDLFKSDPVDTELINIQQQQNPYWMANSLLGFGTGTMPCLRNNLKDIIAPTLLFTGEYDSKFTRINQVMKKELPHAELFILPESGHRVHSKAHFEIAEHLKLFIEKHAL